MTTPNTLHADLSDALELLSKATPGEWHAEDSMTDAGGRYTAVMRGPVEEIAGEVAPSAADAKAIVAAVNLLRTHGAALLEAAGREWQPIETCPDSGDLVLIHCGVDRPALCRADDWHARPSWLEGATHWMPLPASPSEASA